MARPLKAGEPLAAARKAFAIATERGASSMTAKDMPTVGETIGSYDLLEKIAEGGAGIVYKARHWQTNEIVALKVLHKEIARNPVLLKRFEQEFRIAGKLDHPNIVKVLEYCATGGSPYFVMEFVDGKSLGDRLEQEGRMREEEALFIIVQVAHGLHRAHAQGLIHRDIKPDNVLVTKDNKAKLTDLGLAKDTDANVDLTRTGRGLGTPNFMAPEQFRNAKNASVQCDVYSLGATLYQMVTGKLPFGEADPVQLMIRKLRNELPAPRALVPHLSERVDWAIRRAMSADPKQRPASCREFVEDLTGQHTRMGDEAEAPPAEDTWYMIYNDKDGMVRTASGSATELHEAIKEGRYGALAGIAVSRSPGGPFAALNAFPEFRDLVVQPASGPPLSETSAANLAKLGRLMQGAQDGRTIDPAPAAAGVEDLHLSIPTRKAPARWSEPRWYAVLRFTLILVVGATTAVLAAKYLIPLLPALR
jgi:tRNA A-37 threonylcarbamoyl transferase component Bud32